MTKSDLLRLLEPFDDEIDIVLINHGYKYNPYVYYSHERDTAEIILSVNHPGTERTVELK